MELNRFYTVKDIEDLSQRLGYSVFNRCGGDKVDTTGIGLSLSYDIIKAHGGTIEVQTREKEFTKFIVLLPV